MKQLIQNIAKVEYIEARYLQNIIITPNNDVLLRYWRNFHELPIVGLASVTVADQVEHNNRLTTVTLTALTCEKFAVNNRHLAWRVTTVTGDQMLIGTTEVPYPTTTTTENFPDKATEQSGTTLKVEWKTALSLLTILDSYD